METCVDGLLCGCVIFYQYASLSFGLQMKFVVDGVWKVDATRPIVYTEGGHENNVLVVKGFGNLG